MMKASITLSAEKRETLGRGAARELRRQGRVPAIVYSQKMEPVSISLPGNELSREYLRGGFSSKLLEVAVGKTKYFVLAKDIQRHPVSEAIEHVDFLQVEEDSVVTVAVPLRVSGRDRSIGIRRGGALNIVRHKVRLVCTPAKIPSEIVVDISTAMIGDSIHISAIELPEGVQPMIKDRDFTLVTVTGRIKADDKPTEGTADAAGEATEGGEEAETAA